MTQVTELTLDPEWTTTLFSLLFLLVGVFSSVFLFVLCATESESEEQPPTTIATIGKPGKLSRTSMSKASSSRPPTLKAATSSHHLNACRSSSTSGPKASLTAAQGKQTAAAAALKQTSSQTLVNGRSKSTCAANQLSTTTTTTTSNHKVPALKESVLVKSKVGGGHAQPPAPKVLEAKRLAPSCSASNNNGAAGGKQLVSGKNFGMKTGESDAQRVGVVGGNESSTVNSFARVEPRKTEHFEGGMQLLVSNIPAPDELIISKLPKQQQ